MVGVSRCSVVFVAMSLFFFTETAATEIYTLSLHDALPICKGSGFLNLPHDVTIGRNGEVLVLDRENRRCQVFDQEGTYISEFEGLRSPNDMVIDEAGFFHIAEGWYQEIASICVMSPQGSIIGRWRESGDKSGAFQGAPHGLWIDSKGNMYVAEVGANKAIHKFARI